MSGMLISNLHHHLWEYIILLDSQTSGDFDTNMCVPHCWLGSNYYTTSIVWKQIIKSRVMKEKDPTIYKFKDIDSLQEVEGIA